MKLWLPIIFFGLLWADLVRQLSYQWEANEQYAYGWFVPFLALALFWKRWATRPMPQPRTPPFWQTMTFVLVGLSLLPIRVVHEINPDWPLCNWLLALVVVSLSLYGIFLAGGLPWARHFLFPICFILIAVRWPYRIEHDLTQGLMRVVAGLTVEILGWFNLPALQRGNLIELNTGVVGIDEACSGIRSFQSTLMAALFLGELYFLKWPRRILLLLGGVALAFCFNVVRTLILTWQASTAGLSALEKWHDPAGLMIFLVSFACLWAMAGWLRGRGGDGPLPTDHAPLTTLNPQPYTRRYLIAVGCWAVCVVAFTELWYRSHEIKNPGFFHWSVNLPRSNPAFKEIELAPRSIQLLGYDLSATGQWQQDDGSQWSLYFFRWLPRSIGSVIMSRIHRPDRCLPAAGMLQVSDAGIKYFAAGRLNLPFRRYTYESDGKTVHVYFCQWEDGNEKQGGLQGSNQSDRLRSVMVGRRRVGNQSLELMVVGYATLEEADRAFEQRLPEMIRVDDQPITPAG